MFSAKVCQIDYLVMVGGGCSQEVDEDDRELEEKLQERLREIRERYAMEKNDRPPWWVWLDLPVEKDGFMLLHTAKPTRLRLPSHASRATFGANQAGHELGFA